MLHHSVQTTQPRPALVYIEPTTDCNLACRTCMRNVWDEPPGNITLATFEHILDGLRTFQSGQALPAVFFGGYGEPLAHPQILNMIAAARQLGSQASLISNGTLLDARRAAALISLQVERLWVSIDGATPAGYADVRLGDLLPLVIENLIRLQALKQEAGSTLPHLGISFVAMQRNLAELPAVERLAQSLGADQVLVTNVLAHTPELCEQILYGRSLYQSQAAGESTLSNLPRMDPGTRLPPGLSPSLFESSTPVQQGLHPRGACPFMEKRSLSIRWDGEVSPCLPLLHSHQSYLDDRLRKNKAFSVGNINQRSLLDLWNAPGYTTLRERLSDFDFSPCSMCNSCEMASANLEDCFGNLHPTCGGCLWAQGFIRCP